MCCHLCAPHHMLRHYRLTCLPPLHQPIRSRAILYPSRVTLGSVQALWIHCGRRIFFSHARDFSVESRAYKIPLYNPGLPLNSLFSYAFGSQSAVQESCACSFGPLYMPFLVSVDGCWDWLCFSAAQRLDDKRNCQVDGVCACGATGYGVGGGLDWVLS